MKIYLVDDNNTFRETLRTFIGDFLGHEIIGESADGQHFIDHYTGEADIVLMDDNFASIVNGIEEGRIIFDNIRKTIAYTMAHIFPEILSAALSLLGLLPLGLTAMQVL